MEDTLMVDRLGEDVRDNPLIVPAQIGDDDARMIAPSLRSGQAFGAQSQQEGVGTLLGVVGVELDVQQVVGRVMKEGVV